MIQQKKKTVRFRVPLIHDEASISVALADDVNHDHNQVCRRISPALCEEGKSAENSHEHEDHQYDAYNSWYTAKELHLFRSDISFTIINWMILNDGDDSNGYGSTTSTSTSTESSSINISSTGNNSSVITDRKHKLFTNMITQKDKNYTYCVRGIECRTPIEKAIKSRRRKDALHSVFTFQKKNRRRIQQHTAAQVIQRQEHQEQEQHQQCNIKQLSPSSSSSYQQRKERKQIVLNDHDEYVEALAKIYASYCKESCALAMERGKSDSISSSIIVDDDVIATTITADVVVETKSRTKMKQQMNKEKMLMMNQHPTGVVGPSNNQTVPLHRYYYHSLCDDMCDDTNNNDDDSDIVTAFFCGGYTLIPFFYKNILSQIYIDY